MKLLVVLALFCFVAYSEAIECGTLQRLKVKQQWALAFSTGVNREHFGLALWKSIFARAPEARPYFKRVNGDNILSAEFQAHIQRVLGGLDMCFSLLDEEDTLNAQLAHLNGQHDERDIPSHYFEVFKEAVMQVVPAVLAHCFDRAAWSACFDIISDGIRTYK